MPPSYDVTLRLSWSAVSSFAHVLAGGKNWPNRSTFGREIQAQEKRRLLPIFIREIVAKHHLYVHLMFYFISEGNI